MLNPDLFDIEQLKMMGLWPVEDSISRGIGPYIRRIKNNDISVSVKGDLKGEIARDLFDTCPSISKIIQHNEYTDDQTEYKALYEKNLANYKDKISDKLTMDMDVVCIEKSACTYNNFMIHYSTVKHGGIFCGSGHDTREVKEELNRFRRYKKIGTPIQVIHKTIFFWYVR